MKQTKFEIRLKDGRALGRIKRSRGVWRAYAGKPARLVRICPRRDIATAEVAYAAGVATRGSDQ